MNTDEKKWFEIVLFNYYDDKFESKINLNCSICSSTNYFGNLNPISLKLSLKSNVDNLSKHIFLNLENCIDLKKYFDKVKTHLSDIKSSNNLTVRKRYNKKDLFFIFKFNEDTIYCTMRIMSNTSDYLDITFPLFPTFTSIYNCFTQFINSNVDLTVNINNTFKNNESNERVSEALLNMTNSLNEIKMLLRKTEDIKIEVPEDVKEFDEFIGQELHNINIPEMKGIENPRTDSVITGINNDKVSVFCNRYLDWNIDKFENIVCEIFTKDNHIEYLHDIFKDYSKQYEVFPFINELDKKAVYHLSYFTKEMLLYKDIIINEIFVKDLETLRNYYIPPKDSKFPSVNIELAYDILSIYIFFKLYREMMILKSTNYRETKTEFVLALNCVFLPFTVPALFYESKNTIERKVIERINVFNNKLFKKYINKMKECDFKPFTDTDIKWKIDEFHKNFIDKYETSEDVHDDYYLNHSYVLPYKNDFNLEQIKKCIVPIEIRCCPKRWDLINDEFLDKYECNDENVRKFLKAKKPITHHKIKKESNLERYINSKIDEIPKEWRSSLKLLINNITSAEKDFVITDFEYPYEELSEDVIKALYCWKPSITPEIISNYNKYLEIIDDCLLSKQSIIDLLKVDNENNNEQDDDEIDWDSFL